LGDLVKKGDSRLRVLIWRLQIWRDSRGQDLIEYALMAGFVAIVAGAIMPGVASAVSKIFSKISSVMGVAASQANRMSLPFFHSPRPVAKSLEHATVALDARKKRVQSA
jgi:pilus assembly protein Flp/PilA